MKKKQLAALFLALAMIFSLAACGGDDNGGSGGGANVSDSGGGSGGGGGSGDSGGGGGGGTSDSGTGDSSGYVTPLDLTSAASLSSVQKDVINVGIPADVANFNPWSFTGRGANQALMSLYQPLLHHEQGEYFSAIGNADSVVISEDGTSMDIEIFDYIYDWAGNHITVDDVIFSLNKAAEDAPQYRELFAELVKNDDYNMTIKFTHALDLDDMDSFVRLFIVSEKAFNESPDGMATTPVGTGPYKMTSYTSGYSMTYEKVEDYWQTDTSQLCVRDMATVNTINYYIISEAAQRTMALEAGTIDICMEVNSDDLEKFNNQNGYKLAEIVSNESMTMFFNCDASSPCSDLNLRLALAYATSSEAILTGTYDGLGSVTHGFTPSWAVGFDPAWETEDNYYNYDVEKAKEYLDQSDYSGEELVIMCSANNTSTTTAQLIQSFLGQVGVNSTIESYEDTVFSQYSQDPTRWDIMLDTSRFNVYYAEGVYASFSKDRFASGGGINFVFSDELQELIATCLTQSGNTPENRQLLHEHLIANCYAKSLVNTVEFFIVPEETTGVGLNFRGYILPGACTYAE